MNQDAVIDLKFKFIEDFNKFRKALYVGRKLDYTNLISMLVVVNNPDFFDINTYEYFITHE